MSRRQKLIEKMRTSASDIRFQEVDALLKYAHNESIVP